METIILAAGLSSRMGGNQKVLLSYRGKSLVSRVAQAALSVGNVTVVTGHQAEKVEAELNSLFAAEIASGRLKYVRNPEYAKGQITSAIAGLRAIETDEPFYITVGDLPLIEAKHFSLLAEKLKESDYLCLRPVSDGVPGHPVLFRPEMREYLLNCKKASVKEALSDLQGIGFFTSEDPAFRTDIDNSADYFNLC